MLLESCVHECDAIFSVFVGLRDVYTFFAVPCDCVSSDAVKATHTHTVVSSGSKHENSKAHIGVAIAGDLDIECIWMRQLRTFPLVIVVLGHIVL